MKKKATLSVLVCLFLVFGSVTPAAAVSASAKATVATGRVTLNGIEIDNSSLRYPLLVYKEITYFPMTYYLCHFMGLAINWDQAMMTLTIDAGGTREAYVPELGKTTTGTVNVTIPDYPIYINNVKIDNATETWPFLNYANVTYFPMTWVFTVDAFGWGYAWDMENGLRINASNVVVPPTQPDTGDVTLDEILAIINANYKAGGTYNGTLVGPDGTETFSATMTVKERVSTVDVEFSADPFPFFTSGASYFATYYPNESGLAGEFDTGTGHSGTGSMLSAPAADKNSEKVFIGACPLNFQFAGERSRRITKVERVSVSGSIETWKLDVSYPYYWYGETPFDAYTATVTVDTAAKAVRQIVIETGNYTLTLIRL